MNIILKKKEIISFLEKTKNPKAYRFFRILMNELFGGEIEEYNKWRNRINKYLIRKHSLKQEVKILGFDDNDEAFGVIYYENNETKTVVFEGYRTEIVSLLEDNEITSELEIDAINLYKNNLGLIEVIEEAMETFKTKEIIIDTNELSFEDELIIKDFINFKPIHKKYKVVAKLNKKNYFDSEFCKKHYRKEVTWYGKALSKKVGNSKARKANKAICKEYFYKFERGALNESCY